MNDDSPASTLGPVTIAPSILAADFARLGEEVRAITEGGADYVHVDVMDGHFVPNLTLGPPIIRAVKGATSLPLDVHLMIDNPERYIEMYAEAGADWLSVQVEVCPHLDRVIQQMEAAGVKPGAVLNPHTPHTLLEYVLDRLHHVLVMTVNPGFGGQAFIPQVLPKVEALRRLADRRGLDLRIEVDGGIKAKTIASARSAGADVFVAGSAVFGSPNYAETIATLRSTAQAASSTGL